eukprot:6835375-Pyramimonas_sp.AAC.1
MLYEKAKSIFALGVNVVHRKMLMMLNFKQSVRGAIRQPPNIITWIVTLERLQTCGAATDPQAVVQEWNQQCPKGQQLKGGQAQAVQLVLEKMPRAILAKVIEHVYTVGWRVCMFFDDSLASKKIWLALPVAACPGPGHAPPAQ